MTGVAIFALGFVIWNIDNIFCSTLTGWKFTIGWPVAFLLEGIQLAFMCIGLD
jgi:dihydroceramidase